ncbi:MAG TPA: hypothetical protein VGO35_00295 [Gammaproteobacteria bacterium]|jgi:hypothetical protein|nr:hypothetical protein [Gammaproteobacteria bacterium]
MNVKRGFARVWLSLSLLWIIIAGSVGTYYLAPKFPRSFEVNSAAMANSVKPDNGYYHAKMSLDECGQYREQVLNRELLGPRYFNCILSITNTGPLADIMYAQMYFPECKYGDNDDDGLAYSSSNHHINVKGCTAYFSQDSQAQEIATTVKDAQSEYVKRFWLTRGLPAIAILLIPPTLLWLLMIYLLWLREGFKSNEAKR